MMKRNTHFLEDIGYIPVDPKITVLKDPQNEITCPYYLPCGKCDLRVGYNVSENESLCKMISKAEANNE